MISAAMTTLMSSDKSMVMMTHNLLQYEERQNRLFWLLTFILALTSSKSYIKVHIYLMKLHLLILAILFLSYVNRRTTTVEIDTLVIRSNEWLKGQNEDKNNRPIIGNKY